NDTWFDWNESRIYWNESLFDWKQCRFESNESLSNRNITVPSWNKTVITWADILDPEMKAVTSPFWLKFSPPSMEAQYALGILYIIIMIAGLFGNFIIIFLFSTCKYAGL
ncbi:unnamed protein product, partial [Larinioides sclopetarius]